MHSFLETPDALPGLVETFVGAGLGQPLGEFGEGLLEALGDALDDTELFGRARFGEAVQARLLSVVGHDFVQMHIVVRCSVDAHGLRGRGGSRPGLSG